MNEIAAMMREKLDYRPETGEFVWKKSRRAKIGSVAGSINHDGYVRIWLAGRLHMAHRLAWLWIHGEWPAQEIDHINGKRADNRIGNLREASRSTNMQNQRAPHRQSRTQTLGVSCRAGRFIARIQVGGVQRALGSFDTADLASAAYQAAKRVLHAEVS